MKITILLYTVLMTTFMSFRAQNADRGTLHLSPFGGVEYQNARNSYSFDPPAIAGGIVGGVNLQYYTHKNVGFNVEGWLTANSEIDRQYNSTQIGLGLNYSLIVRENFSLQIGATFGISNLTFTSTVEDSTGIHNAEINASGNYQKLSVRVNKYFGASNRLGLFGELAILNSPVQWNRFIYDGTESTHFDNNRVADIRTVRTGGHARIGITYYLSL